MKIDFEKFNNFSNRWWDPISEQSREKIISILKKEFIIYLEPASTKSDDYSLIKLGSENAISRKPRNIIFNLSALPRLLAEAVITISSGVAIPVLLPLCAYIILEELKKITTIEFSFDEVTIISALFINQQNKKPNDIKNIIKTSNSIVKKSGKHISYKKKQVISILQKLEKYRIVSKHDDEWKIVEQVVGSSSNEELC
ncbi:MAG: hypothetical protein A2161_07695 [Candidatus Schekmanbacteria bacterium RBG_13_48_7]|uniref:Uncharacterized protein n=1 Tax=Candidatus Schekmanbacteria bacterium RBG_13_48_7 TaxID=1817878 RepID=A0A1F7S549_9BACT|nr:MAG: hypothetical protein A2161_07695 [Candidatus Schekmanbacteria bacterium RBG_13_48_7]